MKQLFGFLILVVICSGCSSPEETGEKVKPAAIRGEAQGTTYSILYFTQNGDSIEKAAIDSILADVDASLSTWEPNSLISELNNLDSTSITFDDYHGYFTDMVKYSRQMYQLTDGLFDPTVGALVNAWGFGFKNKENMTQKKVDSLAAFVGFGYDDVRLTRFDDRNTLDPKRVLVKRDTAVELDFNAIAQGYSVDVLGDYLEVKNISNYLIELGGEMLARGTKPGGVAWKVGIDEPKENLEERSLNATIELRDEAIATSGNYRKFYIENGVKYSHTIDPKTGYPVRHNLLSATVIAKECWKADALATAFMVMGTDRTKAFLKDHPDLEVEVYLISDKNGEYETYSSEKLEKRLIEL